MQGDIGGIVSRLETIMSTRDSQVSAAMADFQADDAPVRAADQARPGQRTGIAACKWFWSREPGVLDSAQRRPRHPELQLAVHTGPRHHPGRTAARSG